MSLTTAPSSADILQFDPNQPANRPEHNARGLKFAQVSKAWLLQWQADDRLTHADQALVTQIYAHFNWTHFEKTGELLAWPSWETIAAEASVTVAQLNSLVAAGRGTRWNGSAAKGAVFESKVNFNGRIAAAV